MRTEIPMTIEEIEVSKRRLKEQKIKTDESHKVYMIDGSLLIMKGNGEFVNLILPEEEEKDYSKPIMIGSLTLKEYYEKGY